MRALVVDDSAVMRKLLTGALERAEITEVTHAKTGQEGVDTANAGRFDLILMDWILPTMSGLDAVRAIRESGDETPIIMVTTEAERNRVIEALQAGANNYIIKPFEPNTMVEKIKTVLEKAKQQT
jgi:two-component system, chemotaxis family, chemotaxis protein CheY